MQSILHQDNFSYLSSLQTDWLNIFSVYYLFFPFFLMHMNFFHHLSLQTRLRDRCESPQLLMDTKMIYPVTFPFNPSCLALETIQIPSSLNLAFLTRV